MKDGKRKVNTTLVAMCMLMAAFLAVLSVPVGADEDVGGDIEALWVNAWMEEQPEFSDPADKLIQFNYDDVGTDAYHLGDENVAVHITLRNNDAADAIYVDQATLLSNHALFTVNQDTDDGNTIPASGIFTFEFTIDIGTSGSVSTLYVDALTIDLEGLEQPPATPISDESFDFDIYVSSVFDDDSDDDHEDLPFIDETDTDTEFESGVNMQEGELELTEYADYSITDVEGTLSSLATGIALTGGYDIALNPTGGGTFSLFWRFDVAADATPGLYDMNVAFEYVRSDTGETINEAARPTGLYVDYTTRVTASLQTAVQITQNTLEATLSVIFTNEGNVPLSDLVVGPSIDGDWLDVKFHHYENNDDVYVTEMDLGDLAMGASSTAVDVVIATNMMLPNGDHRLPFVWNGWYFEDGATGGASRWVETGGFMYNNDGNDETEEVGAIYEDIDENGVFNPGDAMLEPLWEGAFVDFNVDDDNGLTWQAVIWDTVEAGENGEVRFTTIEVNLYNFEMVDYKDIFVTMTVGPTTPFLDPKAHAATTLDMDPNSDTTIGAATPGNPGEASVYFTVDVNAAWWQTDSFAPETYEITIQVDATNNHDEVRIEDTPINAVVNIDGFGPELFASAVTTTRITPGEDFELTVTITNFGDDIAREVDAYLRADFVSGWTILDQFVTSISSYGGSGSGGNVGDATWGWSVDQYHEYWGPYDSFNRSNDVKPGDVGVDNVPQIVELYDWITRRETPPQGIVLWMHLDRLAPDETWEVTFQMESDVNMVEGMAYYETLELYYVDSNGETYGPDPEEIDYDHYTPPQQVLIKKGKGSEYVGEDEFDYQIVMWIIVALVIGMIIFIIGFALGGRGGGGGESSMADEPYEPYESPYSDTEPGIKPEEDLGPPFPPEEPPPE